VSTYAIYRVSDGIVISHLTCPPRLLERNIPEGCAAIEVQLDPQAQRVDPETKEVVDRPPQTPNYDSDVLALARETIERIELGQIRAIREALLGDATAVERLREQEPDIATARATIQRLSRP
jgi:hypothetical protein